MEGVIQAHGLLFQRDLKDKGENRMAGKTTGLWQHVLPRLVLHRSAGLETETVAGAPGNGGAGSSFETFGSPLEPDS